MPALRIATAGAALLVLTAGSTIAQPTGTATSKPISILKILAPSDNAKIKPHGHRLGMPTWRTHAAAHQKTRHLLAVAPAAAVQADIWADPEAATATQVASDEPEQQGAAVPPNRRRPRLSSVDAPSGSSPPTMPTRSTWRPMRRRLRRTRAREATSPRRNRRRPRPWPSRRRSGAEPGRHERLGRATARRDRRRHGRRIGRMVLDRLRAAANV